MDSVVEVITFAAIFYLLVKVFSGAFSQERRSLEADFQEMARQNYQYVFGFTWQEAKKNPEYYKLVADKKLIELREEETRARSAYGTAVGGSMSAEVVKKMHEQLMLSGLKYQVAKLAFELL